MADFDLSKLAPPEMYRFVKAEVPGGRVLAPLAAWALLGALIAWCTDAIWRGFGSPVVNISTGQPVQWPSIDTYVVVIISLAVFFALRRAFRQVLSIQSEHSRRQTDGIVTAAEAVRALSEAVVDLQSRVSDLESRR